MLFNFELSNYFYDFLVNIYPTIYDIYFTQFFDFLQNDLKNSKLFMTIKTA